MATSMNKNMQETKSTVGLLLIIGEIISNDQRDEICIDLKQALKKVDNKTYHEIIDLFNNLIHENEFQIDCQYRQIADTENGSVAGFVYLPNHHALFNVFKDLFNTCYHVCIIYCGQQIDSNGALILSDSLFTCDHFYSLFEDNSSYLVQDLQIILPFVSNQWIKLSNNYLEKKLKYVQIDDLSGNINQENSFGQVFYERLIQTLTKDSTNFDIYTKLIPRDNSGTIAFEEPNLYVLYGQQGEASLFGVRGFVVLVNGGFSRIPSYWNLIRGLQNIDACILTHFDYDVFPGLQTILHRKAISSQHDNQLCKPDIGAIFLNHIQRTKIQSVQHSLKSLSNSKLLINLNENIDEFLNDIKQLNIDAIDLVKNSMLHKQNIEPINLFKKIAFGSLDLYILHPTSSISEDEKILANLQKIPIRDQQPSPSIIPFHHWYSSCLLLVWTPSSLSSKNNSVRILYTGACPQTLVFEALNKVRHLEFLHEPQQQQRQQQQRTHTSNIKTTLSTNTNTGVKHSSHKPKISPPVTDRVTSSTVQSKTPKVSPRPISSKPKVSQSRTIKTEKPRSTPIPRKMPPLKTNSPARSNNKDKEAQKPRGTTAKSSTKHNQMKNHVQKPKTQDDQKQKLDVPNKEQQKLDIPNEEQQKLDVPNEEQQKLDIPNEEQQKLDVPTEEQQNLDISNEEQQKLDITNEDHQEIDANNEHEQKLEIQNEETEQSSEIQLDLSFQNDSEEQSQEKNKHDISPDELNENNETAIDNHEDEIQRPESVPLAIDHNEPFVESHTDSPKDEMQPESGPDDPMTTSFIDESSNTKNPLIIKKTNDDNNIDDEMEIIHRDISPTNQHSVPSIDEINPQGLPIENDVRSIKPTIKKLSNASNRTNEPTKSTNNINQTSSQKSKQTSMSNSIFNVDVAYIPFHGNEHYVDEEFFRRVRARYYILNAVQISRLTLESLIEGKQQWENKEHAPVTLVPTFDGEQLRQFFVTNRNRLAELNINILPASIRCNVQYDNEGSPSQLLRFSSIYNTDEQ
ncbi:unnamed protein product [Rotaria sp. Silwood1]|nr:unnamed protein product [Rotaria sp. Silwood1]CAF4608590.1 unnamed protein product [Rotaria sp. Silwood1]